MSNRSKELSIEITKQLRDVIDEVHSKLVHLAFLQMPGATEGQAMTQANRDLVEMLNFYVHKFGEQNTPD